MATADRLADARVRHLEKDPPPARKEYRVSPDDPLYTETEVRQLLGVSRTTFWKLRHVTKTCTPQPFSTGSRSIKFRRVDVERYLGLAA